MRKIKFMQLGADGVGSKIPGRKIEIWEDTEIKDIEGVTYIANPDDNPEVLNRIARLVGQLNKADIIVVGEREKDYYFGDKRLFYEVVESK